MARLRTELGKIQGITLYMQAAQDITIGGRLSKTQYQYTLADVDTGELNHWAAMFLDKIKTLPGITDVATDQLNAGRCSTSRSSGMSRPATALSPRPSTTRSTTHSGSASSRRCSRCSTNITLSLRSIQSSSTGPKRSTASMSGHPAGAGAALHPGRQCRQGGAARRQSSRPVPVGDDPYNLAPGTSIGYAVSAIQQVEKELDKPLSLQTSFQGNAQAFQTSLSSTPILIAAALAVVIYLILGVLYESLIHPITIISTLPSAGLGALLLLMAVHYDLSVIAIVGIILLIGIVKKNGIMLVDFRPRGGAKRRPDAGAINLPSLRAALPADPDDDDGGTAWRRADDAGQRSRAARFASRLVTPSSEASLCRRFSTLYTTPVVYLYLERLQSWIMRRRGGSRGIRTSRRAACGVTLSSVIDRKVLPD